jgi:hypothetical protein
MDRTLTVVKELTKHPQYHAKNPNNIYSLVGGFVMANQYCFHGAPEQSYAFLASQITLLNTVNPQVCQHSLFTCSIIIIMILSIYNTNIYIDIFFIHKCCDVSIMSIAGGGAVGEGDGGRGASAPAQQGGGGGPAPDPPRYARPGQGGLRGRFPLPHRCRRRPSESLTLKRREGLHQPNFVDTTHKTEHRGEIARAGTIHSGRAGLGRYLQESCEAGVAQLSDK